MAAKTFSEIYNDVLQQVDETTGSGSTVAKTIVKAGINEAYSMAAGLRNWKTLEDATTITTSQGTAEYTPTASAVASSTPRIRRIISVLDQTDNKYIQEISREVFEKTYPYVDPSSSTNQSTPRLWYESGYDSNRNVKLILYPVPASAGTFQVRYYFEPPAMVGDDTIPLLPDQFHYGLGYWAAAKYYEYQREFISNYYRELHQQWISDMLNAEYGPVIEMPQIQPQTKTTNFIIGKIGRIYN